MNIQKGKDMVRQHDTADHQADHRKKNQYVNDQLKDAGGRNFPLKQAFIPVPIEGMMDDKYKKHSGPCPLVGDAAPELVAN